MAHAQAGASADHDNRQEQERGTSKGRAHTSATSTHRLLVLKVKYWVAVPKEVLLEEMVLLVNGMEESKLVLMVLPPLNILSPPSRMVVPVVPSEKLKAPGTSESKADWFPAVLL